MAFELKDWYHSYTNRGGIDGLFNVARSDEDSEVERYYAFYNELGSYVIQRVTTSGTLGLKVYKYYSKRGPQALDADWAARSSLTYVEYYLLFNQGL